MVLDMSRSSVTLKRRLPLGKLADARLRICRAILSVILLASGPAQLAAAAGDERAEDDAAQDDAALDVETILANPLEDDAYRTSQNCISTRSYDGVEVLDDKTLLFHGRRGVWLNRLLTRCRGLSWEMIPTVESHGSRVCEHDRFRGRPRSGFPESTSCTLGKFEKIDEAQVESLRAARGGDPGSGP